MNSDALESPAGGERLGTNPTCMSLTFSCSNISLCMRVWEDVGGGGGGGGDWMTGSLCKLL